MAIFQVTVFQPPDTIMVSQWAQQATLKMVSTLQKFKALRIKLELESHNLILPLKWACRNNTLVNLINKCFQTIIVWSLEIVILCQRFKMEVDQPTITTGELHLPKASQSINSKIQSQSCLHLETVLLKYPTGLANNNKPDKTQLIK